MALQGRELSKLSRECPKNDSLKNIHYYLPLDKMTKAGPEALE